ncbi:hypothetical protein NL676_039356 [Syzygium grande]|nr:hypothetical protein NL676_039356 [Syzygium grande]
MVGPPHSSAVARLVLDLESRSSKAGSGVVPPSLLIDLATAAHPQVLPSGPFVVVAAHPRALVFILLAKNEGLGLRNQPDEEEDYPKRNHKKLLGHKDGGGGGDWTRQCSAWTTTLATPPVPTAKGAEIG